MLPTHEATTRAEPPTRSKVFLLLFTSRTLLCSIAIAWTIFWIGLSVKTNNWNWFARSGSVLGIIGGVLSCRSVLRLTREERVRIRSMTVIECFAPSELEDQERDSGAVVIGVVMLLLQRRRPSTSAIIPSR